MMHIGVIGLNHRSGFLALREKLTRALEKIFEENALSFESAVLLVTCNRVELYFSSKKLAATHMEILHTLSRYGMGEVFYALYSYFGRECFLHLGKVITGMDSAIFGESEIQRQVKLAYEKRRQRVTLCHDLHYLFQKALKIGKQLRSCFLMQTEGRELFELIEKMTKWLGIDLREASALVVGHSRLGRKMMTFLQNARCRQLTLCTREKEVKVSTAIRVAGWEVLRYWQQYDLVICATCHKTFVLDEQQSGEKGRKPTLVFDLGVPRNVNPAICRSDVIYLYHLEQLEKLLPNRRKAYAREQMLCEDTLCRMIDRQMALFAQRRKAKWHRGVGVAQETFAKSL